jgi:hypothetical protein
VPLVGRAFGAQPVGDLRIEEAGDPPKREVAAGVEARLPRPTGVSLLRRRLRIVGARNERGRLA